MRATLREARVILWHGFCSVHKRFTVEQINLARLRHPGVHVIVHPECTMEVVDAADESGSTDLIRKRIESAPAGSIFAVGTEINMVQRLANEHPDQTIFCLDSIICPCSTMYRIHPSYLAWVLEALERGEVLNRITVAEEIADPARVALERMLSLQPTRSDSARQFMNQQRNIIVVGSGIAGLIAALRLADRSRVTLVTKSEIAESNTRWAQGGIAAAIFPDDSVAEHVADTMRAGAGLCNREAVEVLCSEGPARIRDLIRLGVPFDERDGDLARGLEAAHSRARVLHAQGDATGLSIEMTLVRALRSADVEVLEHTFACDLSLHSRSSSGAQNLAERR